MKRVNQTKRVRTKIVPFFSRLNDRELPYCAILPAGYENSSQKFPVLYLLHGLFGRFDNWTTNTNLTAYAEKFSFIIVCAEGGDAWWTDNAEIENHSFESYLTEELIPGVEEKFNVRAERNSRAIAGLSMGGYGALKFGLKYPEMFFLVGSFSGALGAASWTEKDLGGRNFIAESIMSVYGAADSRTRQENDVYKMTREISPEKIKQMPFVYLDCGTEDFLIQSNRDYAALLYEKKIPHEFRQLPGKHDWRFWDAQIQEFFELSETKLSQIMVKAN